MEKLSKLAHFTIQSVMTLLLVGGVLTSMGLVDFGLKDFWVVKEKSPKIDKVSDKKSTVADKEIKTSSQDKPKDLKNNLDSVNKAKVATKSGS